MVLNQTFGLNSLRQDLNRLFYSAPIGHAPIQPGFFGQSTFAPSIYGQMGASAPAASLYPTAWQNGQFMPRTNVAETPEATIVIVELPGVELNQVALRIEGACLVLEGVRHPGGLLGDRMISYTAAEGRFGAFRWVCPIPNGTVAPAIEASCRNGLLTIVLPRVTAQVGVLNQVGLNSQAGFVSPVGINTLAGASAMATAPSAQVVITPGING